jgi:hypothetical protein
MEYALLISAFVILVMIMILVNHRDQWNPPTKAPATPKVLNQKRSAPYNIYGRPTILNPKWATPHVEEEIEEFTDFLKDIRGTVMNKSGKIPIRYCSGKLMSWSYKPFREGYWKDFITSGLTDPKTFYWFGTESMIPNPRKNIVESPLTLVRSEEDILRFIGGSAKVRIFSSNQPTFPKFNTDEHGDSIIDHFNHRIKGEEFVATDGMILSIPRGWAYRIQLDNQCTAVIRLPVYNVLSWLSCSINMIRSRTTQKQQPKARGRYSSYGSDKYIEDAFSEGGSVSDTNSESSE